MTVGLTINLVDNSTLEPRRGKRVKSAANWQKTSLDPAAENFMWARQETPPGEDGAPSSSLDWDDDPAAPIVPSSKNYAKPTVSEIDAEAKVFGDLVAPTGSSSVEPAPRSTERSSLALDERVASFGLLFAFSKLYVWSLVALSVSSHMFSSGRLRTGIQLRPSRQRRWNRNRRSHRLRLPITNVLATKQVLFDMKRNVSMRQMHTRSFATGVIV